MTSEIFIICNLITKTNKKDITDITESQII